MQTTISKPKVDSWKVLFRDIILYLLAERGTFVVIKHLCHLTEEKLIGPYTAIAVPGVIFLVLVRWLWMWEARRPSPRRLALGWGVSISMFFCALSVAFFYTTVELGFFNADDAVWIMGMAGVSSTLLGFFIPYNMTLERLSAVAASNTNDSRSR